MCKLIVNYEERLGSRRTGWILYSPKTNDFIGLTDKTIKKQMELGDDILGLKFNEQNEIILDEAFTQSILSRTGINTFTSMTEQDTSVNKAYMLAEVKKSKSGNIYKLITSRCGIEEVSEDRIRSMLLFMGIGGIRLENNKLILHKAINIINLDTPDEQK